MKKRRDNRNARRVKAQAILLGARVAEQKYRRKLVAIMRALHQSFMSGLEPHLEQVAKGHLRQDAGHSAWKKKIDQLNTNIAAVRKPVGEAFDEMAKKVNKSNFEAAKQLLGVTPTHTRTAEAIAQARDENIRLVENAGRAYADDVREIFDDPDTFGMRAEELKELLLERGSVSESRAELIARDQTLKLNGKLNEIRQTNAGVERYTWSTSEDERVRPTHAELDGQEFSWSEPPIIDGEPLHPGEDFQCRCAAIPVIDEIDDILAEED